MDPLSPKPELELKLTHFLFWTVIVNILFKPIAMVISQYKDHDWLMLVIIIIYLEYAFTSETSCYREAKEKINES